MSIEATTSMPTRTSSGRVAADVMNPSPRTCSKFSRVIEAVMIFKDEECGMVPIIEEGKPIGVVTDRDVALALCGHDNLVQRPVSEIMSKDIISVTANTSLEAVAAKFASECVRRLLVVDDAGLLLGVIGWKDVANELPARSVGQMVSNVVEAPSHS
jgi:predicted transcriptional regulator